MKMTTEYMVDLHKFLYLSNDTDFDGNADVIYRPSSSGSFR